MPLLQRPIEPSSITRTAEGQIPSTIKHELEFVANTTRANLIRQLSSLSKHAEDMFRELFVEATSIFERTTRLGDKVEQLRESVQQYDPNQVVVRLTDITKRKPYKTEYHTDQQICTRNTMPTSLQIMYQQCAAPPRLDRFDEFRSDSKASIKTYTNPDYFVQLWLESIQKNVAEDKKKHGDRKIKKRPSKKQAKRELQGDVMTRAQKNAYLKDGAEFVPKEISQSRDQRAHGDRRANKAQSPKERRISETSDAGQYQRQTSAPSGDVRVSQPAPAPPPPPVPSAPALNQGHHLKYQEMIYDSYNINQQPPANHSQSPPNMVQSTSASSHISRTSSNMSPGMNRMTMPPPPPPPTGHNGLTLPTPPSPPQDYEIVPPPPTSMDTAIRPASPPPPLDPGYIPAGAPSPPRMSVSPPQQPPVAPIPVGVPPPPPPPPPPSGMGGPPAPPLPPPALAGNQQPNADMLSAAAAGLRSTQNVPKPAAVQDERSELLNQIRLGIQLRGAEERKQHENRGGTLDKKEMLGGGFDVQSIMDKVQEMRRVMENSDDSDSDYEDDWDADDD